MVYRSGFGYTTVYGFTEERYTSNLECWATDWEVFLNLHTTVCRRCAGSTESEYPPADFYHQERTITIPSHGRFSARLTSTLDSLETIRI